MAVVKLLGVLDIACAVVLGLLAASHAIPHVQAPLAVALACKGAIFSGNVTSRIDIVCAIGMLALLWFPSAGIAIAIAAYLGVKGVASLF